MNEGLVVYLSEGRSCKRNEPQVPKWNGLKEDGGKSDRVKGNGMIWKEKTRRVCLIPHKIPNTSKGRCERCIP